MFIIKVTETTFGANENSEVKTNIKYIGKKGKVLSENKLPNAWWNKYNVFETKRAAIRQMELEKEFYERYRKPKGFPTCSFEIIKF